MSLVFQPNQSIFLLVYSFRHRFVIGINRRLQTQRVTGIQAWTGDGREGASADLRKSNNIPLSHSARFSCLSMNPDRPSIPADYICRNRPGAVRVTTGGNRLVLLLL